MCTLKTLLKSDWLMGGLGVFCLTATNFVWSVWQQFSNRSAEEGEVGWTALPTPEGTINLTVGPAHCHSLITDYAFWVVIGLCDKTIKTHLWKYLLRQTVFQFIMHEVRVSTNSLKAVKINLKHDLTNDLKLNNLPTPLPIVKYVLKMSKKFIFMFYLILRSAFLTDLKEMVPLDSSSYLRNCMINFTWTR